MFKRLNFILCVAVVCICLQHGRSIDIRSTKSSGDTGMIELNTGRATNAKAGAMRKSSARAISTNSGTEGVSGKLSFTAGNTANGISTNSGTEAKKKKALVNKFNRRRKKCTTVIEKSNKHGNNTYAYELSPWLPIRLDTEDEMPKLGCKYLCPSFLKIIYRLHFVTNDEEMKGIARKKFPKMLCFLTNLELLAGSDLFDPNKGGLCTRFDKEVERIFGKNTLKHRNFKEQIRNFRKLMDTARDNPDWDRQIEQFENLMSLYDKTFSSTAQVAKNAEHVCSLYAFSQIDPIPYINNFLRLVTDDNFVHEKEHLFQCKLFRSRSMRKVHMCATSHEGNTFRRRRLLTTQSKSMSQYKVGASKATLERPSEDEEDNDANDGGQDNEAEAGNDGGEDNEAGAGDEGGQENEAEAGDDEGEKNCKPIFLDLQKSVVKGFGVARDPITMKYQGLKVKLEGSGDITVHTNKHGKSRVATHDATFECTEDSKICCQKEETRLKIMAKTKPTTEPTPKCKKESGWWHCGDCVIIKGTSWRVDKCNSRRRRLLHRSRASFC